METQTGKKVTYQKFYSKKPANFPPANAEKVKFQAITHIPALYQPLSRNFFYFFCTFPIKYRRKQTARLNWRWSYLRRLIAGDRHLIAGSFTANKSKYDRGTTLLFVPFFAPRSYNLFAFVPQKGKTKRMIGDFFLDASCTDCHRRISRACTFPWWRKSFKSWFLRAESRTLSRAAIFDATRHIGPLG